MTSNIEKIYSEALFSLASEQGRADAVNAELALLSKIFESHPDMVKVLNAPTIDGEEKADFIEKVFKGRTSEITYNFIRLITDKKRASYLSAISESFKDRVNDMKNIVEIKVTSASPLNEGARSRLKTALEASYNKSVILEEAVDPEILGGIVVSYGNTLLDGSVKTKLQTMRNQLKNTMA
ncbi:MAG: ATP synthase F1 subunit delta [Oscillospiraceae bacterium]|nr:ATP synthase F1 subunit delta [Oscillospiraceae bacterium]